MNINIYTTLACVFALSVQSQTLAMTLSSDPLAEMSYERAFDQEKLHKEFGDVMTNLRCHTNVPNKSFSNTSGESTPATRKRRREEYETACVKRLKAEQNRTLIAPAYTGLTKIGLYLSLMCTSVGILGTENSDGGSFSVFAACHYTADQLYGVIRAGYHLWRPPDNLLAPLEEAFAKDQCFIPHELWPTIREKFMVARTNPLEQRKAMEYLRFVLGLTQFKPQRELGTTITEQQLAGLYTSIDGFFADYTETPSVSSLKTAAANFLASSMNHTQPAQGHIYLQGPPGRGKTHFANWLYKTMAELAPRRSLSFQEVTINGSDDLEGGNEKAGLTLRLLQQQLTAQAQGTVVLYDEAGFLCPNDPGMLNTVKRTFQVGDSSDTFKSTYLGGGRDGTGIPLKRPCLLQLFAGNDEITDAALKSRFTSFKFPAPCKQALIEHTLNALANSTLLSIEASEVENYRSRVEKWIEANEVKDFRKISTDIEAEFLATTHSEK